MEDLSPTQKDTLTQLKINIDDVRNVNHDDLSLLKWLRARSFDLKKTEEMYRKSMKWRAEVGADRILETYTVPDILKKYYPGGVCGHDKTGRPVWIDPLGTGDIKGIINSCKKTEIVRFMVYRMEQMYATFREYSHESSKRIDQCVQIIDVEGFGPKVFWKPAMDLYIEVLHILEANYPETLKRSYMIKAPRLFHVGWNILKRFLDKDTVSKFRFLNSNYTSKLLEIMDADQLPVYYGGTRRDADGNDKCEAEVCYGGDVPMELYTSKDDIFPPDVAREVKTLGRSGTLLVGFSIPDTKHVVSYIFSTNHGSIDFEVFRSPTQSGASYDAGTLHVDGSDVKHMDVVHPIKTAECSRVPEDGLIVFSSPGNYFIQFKNTSRLYRKTLTYVMEVIVPDGDTVRDAHIPITTASQDEDDTT